MKRVCVCVDDFGLHGGINDAVLALLEEQRISAVSCLVDGPAWPRGAMALRENPRQCQIGLHLNFTETLGQPCRSQPLHRLVLAAYARRLDAQAIESEIRRQMDRFEEAMERAPDFVDGHQHVHQLPLIRDVLIEALDKRYKFRKPWVRSCCPPTWSRSGIPASVRWKSKLIGSLGGPALCRLAKDHGYLLNRRLLGVYKFDVSESGYLHLLKCWLDKAEDGDLLMCHPSVPGPWRDPLLDARHREYRVLSGDALAGLMSRAGFRAAPMADWYKDACC